MDYIKKNFLRLWISACTGMGFGMLVEMFVGIWYRPSISPFIMIPIIIGAGVGAWYILANNKNFGKF